MAQISKFLQYLVSQRADGHTAAQNEEYVCQLPLQLGVGLHVPASLAARCDMRLVLDREMGGNVAVQVLSYAFKGMWGAPAPRSSILRPRKWM